MKMAQKFASLFFPKLLLVGLGFVPEGTSALAIMKHSLVSGELMK